VPAISVDDLADIQTKLNGYSLLNNIQSVPIHSNGGDTFSMLFNGYSDAQCPIIG